MSSIEGETISEAVLRRHSLVVVAVVVCRLSRYGFVSLIFYPYEFSPLVIRPRSMEKPREALFLLSNSSR